MEISTCPPWNFLNVKEDSVPGLTTSAGKTAVGLVDFLGCNEESTLHDNGSKNTRNDERASPKTGNRRCFSMLCTLSKRDPA